MYAVIRVKGAINASREVRDTLKMLNIPYINNCAIIPDTKSYQGMLHKVKDYITWGEIEKEAFETLLKKEGKKGGADEIMEGKTQVRDVLHLPIRLHPPLKGYKSLKKPYAMGGSLGYRGKAINELIGRML